jgi:hypothetical protein
MPSHTNWLYRWAFLGLGYTIENRNPEKYDQSPYLSEEAIDPKWLKEVIQTGALVSNGN